MVFLILHAKLSPREVLLINIFLFLLGNHILKNPYELH